MPYSYVQYTGNGSTTNYVFSFPYLESTHIKVRVNGSITSYTFLNSSTVTISPAPTTGAIIDIRRETPKDNPPVDFTDGSVLLESDLDLLARFNLYTAQESSDGVADSITKDTLGVWDAQSRRIKSVADPVNANDAVNKTWAETGMTSQLNSATTQAANAATSASNAATSATTATTQASTATARASEAAASATAAASSATAASGSATTAGTGATTATAQAAIATTKASEAATSATAAASSQSSASGSATTAGAQATIATTKASEASSSASSASASASTATTKADVATAKADEAAGSATAAAGSASAASSSASTASTQASNAASSATAAAGSATTATTQATNAATSATAASGSASAAATSATSAAASASSAAALLDNFDDRYLGPKSSAPSVDNDGNALAVGALYYDTTTAKMRVYTASGWIDASSASVATLATFNYNATAGQTTFSGNDANGVSLSYTVGAVIVTLNGVILEAPGDYAASTGSSVVLTSGAAVGDDLNIYAFGNFLVADTYSQAAADARFINTAGDTMTGALGMASDVSLIFKDSAGATGSNMFHYSVDDNTYIDNVKGGSINIRQGGSYLTRLKIDGSGNVGIGNSSPSSFAGTTNLAFGTGSSGAAFTIYTGTAQTGAIYFADGTSGADRYRGAIEYTHSNSSLIFTTDAAERMRIDSSGDAMIGTTTSNGKLRVNQTDAGARTITASAPASYAATLFRSDSAAASGTGWYHLYGSSSGGIVNNIFIYGNGNIQNANNSYGAISDIKLKENIVDATPKLDKLMQVKVRNYNLKGEYEQHKQIGVIAQELETIFPGLIEETQDRGENDELLETTTKSVKYSVFVPMLVKALQELNAKVDAQAAQIAALQSSPDAPSAAV